MKVEFPQYRKLSNSKSYYKILSPSEFQEIQVMEKRYAVYTLQAKILPERNLVADLIEASTDQYIAIPQSEYEEYLEYCQRELVLVSI